MASIVNFSYCKDVISLIKDWHYGVNWPIVYITYNQDKAYVGETLDAVRRTEQHLKEIEFEEFTEICLISDKTFNKSVILDLESFLIKYMSADGSKTLTNGNAGVVEHNYFYKEAYEDDFMEIWNALIKNKVVSKSLADIENSKLFKYSPYKSLNYEQQKAIHEILKYLSKENNASIQSIVKVSGGAGTGKTILAIYLFKLLVDIGNKKSSINSIEDDDIRIQIIKLLSKIETIRKIGFVVPMSELRTTMKDIFRSIEGLSYKMVLAPEDVVNDRYDLLVVDEAHRLYQRHHLPGQHMYAKFDGINERLMGENFKRNISDYTELDWIIKSSRLQILFYDELQTIRATDIPPERFNEICKPHLLAYYSLFSQMRCKGGNGYYEYVKKVLSKEALTIREYKEINGYTTKVVNSVSELFEIISEKNEEYHLCRVVCGPGWSKEEEININDKTYQWAGEKSDDVYSILSIHKSQGFDLNYAGVIFGKEIYYNEKTKKVEIDKKNLKDNFTKSAGDEAMHRYMINIYLTLMTRGIYGTYVYAVDDTLREYLSKFLN